jgi:hypothetical protein
MKKDKPVDETPTFSMVIHVVDDVESPEQYPIATVPIIDPTGTLINLIMDHSERKEVGKDFSIVTRYFVENFKLNVFNTIYSPVDVYGLRYTYLTPKQMRLLMVKSIVDEKNLTDAVASLDFALSYLASLSIRCDNVKFVIELT